MSKMSIDWHRECLANWASTIIGKKARLQTLENEIAKNEADFMFYNEQIHCALAKGLFEFDRERFMVKKKSEQSSLPTTTTLE